MRLWVALLLAAAAPPRRGRRDAGGPTLAVAQTPFDEFAEPEGGVPVPAPIEVCVKQEKRNRVKNPACGLKWALWNTDRVSEFWEVHELQFYWDDKCTVPFAAGLPISSLTNFARVLKDNTPDKAWDKDESTRWTAQCNVLTLGCAPWSSYIGTQLPGDAPTYNVDHMSQYASLRCVRMLQSPNATKFSRSVATVVWANDTLSGFEVVANYGELSAGFWNIRPAREAGIWRVWNAEATARPWQVAELLFYSDDFCQVEVKGVPISSSSFGVPQSLAENTFCYDTYRGCNATGCLCDAYLPRNAFNGVRLPGFVLPIPLPGYWQAPCAPFAGCREMQAWIGMDFGEAPVVVNCIRIWQPEPEGWPRFGFPAFSTRLLLQQWDGYIWRDQKTFTGIGHGDWSETKPTRGFAWRIANFDTIPGHWEVNELAFYAEDRCGRVQEYMGGPGVRPEGLVGLPVDVNPALKYSAQVAECKLNKGSCSQLAFDQDPMTAWQSYCSPCLQRDAWIGLMYKGKDPPQVRCFRLWQSDDVLHRTEALELGMWDGNEWVVERFESGIGGGTWNHRPADWGTAWRLVTLSETVEPWTLAGLHFHSDAVCTGVVITATPIVCGSDPVNGVDKAFDLDPDGVTNWQVSCTPPSPQSLGCAREAAWIGLQSGGDVLDVRCMRIKQDRLRARQASSAYLQMFDGIKWVPASTFVPFAQLGGGSWQTLPGAQASMWRVAATPVPGGFGVGFSEVGFYRSPDCTGVPIEVNFPNVAPIGSGHNTAREIQQTTGYSPVFQSMGENGVADPGKAFDGDYATFWTDMDLIGDNPGSNAWQAWLGIDMNTQVVDVQCVKFAPAPVKSLQPAWAEFQGWDGRTWATRQSTIAKPTLVIALPAPSAGGWQRRPAPARTMWRVQNAEDLQTWEVIEVEFHERADCRDKALVGTNAIASARSAGTGVLFGGHRLPALAFDRSLDTRWVADCPDKGCSPGQAWVGLNFFTPQSVKCIRIFQSGRYERQARRMTLSAWTGGGWEDQAAYSGLGGNSWNMRPAAPDTLWRLTYVARASVVCTTLPTPPAYLRSWGVSELEFYADDGCSQKLTGQAIASGSWEDTASNSDRVDQSQLKVFSPNNAFDGSTDSLWGAGCRTTWQSPRAKCTPGEEWIGLDVGQQNGGAPVEVRCIRIQQSRALMKPCCDPAQSVRLDRWNGSDWAEATWRHFPDDGPPVVMDGAFSNLGMCPSVADQLNGNIPAVNPGVWERRMRRQMDTCEVPLSGAIKLLTDSLCEKHPLCLEAGYATTVFRCCPMNEATALSKCCCDVPQWKIFEDELTFGIDGKPIERFPLVGIEFVVIRLITVMPWIGIVVSIAFYAMASVKPPEDTEGFSYRVWRATSGALQRWLRGSGTNATIMRVLIRTHPGEKLWVTLVKRGIVLLGGFFVGGFIIWMIFAWLMAEVILRVLLLFALIIRWAKSPYSPKEPSDKKRLVLVLAAPFPGTEDPMQPPNFGALLANLLQSLVMFLTYAIQAIFDIILIRFSFMNMGAVDIRVPVRDIVMKVPRFPLRMEWLTEQIYSLLALAGTVYMEAFTNIFQGVPRCEGPVLVFSGMWLVAITLILVRWLNYDYFGLLAGAKTTLMSTRPMFQKAVSVGVATAFRVFIFVLLQMVMLLFGRALSLLFGVSVDPFQKANGWTCPYADETLAIIIGRFFLVVMGVGAMVVTFLCANGHFLGKRIVIQDWAKNVKMDLSGLDGGGEDHDPDSILRWDTAFAMIPSTLGLWFDSWNVKGFLIEERARVYADQMAYPRYCKVCETYHIPYKEVMKATGMQLSLAWQLFPFAGPILGKACEHFNNPPLFYRGRALKCFHKDEAMAAVREYRERKMDIVSELKYHAAMALAFARDRGPGILLRILRAGMYATILYFTYVINQDNLAPKAIQMFQYVLMIAAAMGLLEFLIPAVLLLVLVLYMKMVHKKLAQEKPPGQKFEAPVGEDPEPPARGRTAWPLIGQVVHGITVGASLGVFLLDAWKDKHVSRDFVVLTGAAAGLCAGLVITVLALLLEFVPGTRIPTNLFFAAYSIGLAIYVAAIAGYSYPFGAQAVIASGAGIILIAITGFAFRAPGLYDDGVTPRPSAVLPLLTTPQAMGGPFGIYVGTLAATLPYIEIVRLLGVYQGFVACAALGYIAGLVYAFATDTLCQRRPGQCAIAAGTCVTITLGVGIHWLVGVVVGTVVGSLVGAYMEARMMKEVAVMSLEPPRFTKSKVMGATGLAQSAPEAPPDVLMLMGPATVVRAETPTRSHGPDEGLQAIGGGDVQDSPQAIAYEVDPQFAITSGLGGMGQTTGWGTSHASGFGGDGGEGPGGSRGFTSKRPPKKYGLGATATNLVAVQGTPECPPGAQRKGWHGPLDEEGAQEEEGPGPPAPPVPPEPAAIAAPSAAALQDQGPLGEASFAAASAAASAARRRARAAVAATASGGESPASSAPPSVRSHIVVSARGPPRAMPTRPGRQSEAQPEAEHGAGRPRQPQRGQGR